jgi:hypothetical protein
LPTWMDRFIKINRDLSLRVTIWEEPFFIES